MTTKDDSKAAGQWTMDMVPYDLRWCCPIWSKVVPKSRWSQMVLYSTRCCKILSYISFYNSAQSFRDAVKNVLADLPVKGGGYPPFPLRVFGQDDFPLRGEGVPPNSAKENSAKKQVFRFENSIFCLFHAFLALFGQFYGLFGPFLTLFNAKNIIFSPFKKKILGKA